GGRGRADLLALLGRQGAVHAPPVQGHADGCGGAAQALGRALGTQRDVTDSYGAHGSPGKGEGPAALRKGGWACKEGEHEDGVGQLLLPPRWTRRPGRRAGSPSRR